MQKMMSHFQTDPELVRSRSYASGWQPLVRAEAERSLLCLQRATTSLSAVCVSFWRTDIT